MSDSLIARLGRAYRAGEVLFKEGEPGTEMFVIQAGLVQISKRVGGVDRPLATLGRGEFLGEMAILNAKPRTATAIAVEDSMCLVIDQRTLEQMIAKNTEIAMRLVKKLAARLDAADALVQILMHPDPQARVLLGIKRHAESFGEPEDGGVRVHVTPEAPAAEVGSAQEHVADVLARLKKLKIVRTDAAGIFVQDVPRLLEFMELLDMPRKFEGA